jgi:uncharacterized protein (TIGR02118 family)
MVKVTIFYPFHQGCWFDTNYYLEQHVPLSKSVFGEFLKGIAIEEHEDSAIINGELISYKIIGHLFFEKEEHFYRKFLPEQKKLSEDALNYTDIIPFIQINKVLVWQTPWISLY